MVYAYMPNFILIGSFCHPREVKNNFSIFSTLLCRDGSAKRYGDKLECRCTTTNLPPYNDIKIVSLFQRIDGKVAQTLSFESMMGKLTKKQNKKLIYH